MRNSQKGAGWDKRLKKCGYQILYQDFFGTIRAYDIRPLEQLLIIYLRGLSARFQASAFYWKDRQVEADLGINHKALQRSRQVLQKKGLIKCVSGRGKINTVYKILPAVLLPSGVDKKIIWGGHLGGDGVDKASTPMSKSNQRVNNIFKPNQIFKGMSDEEKAALKQKGIL